MSEKAKEILELHFGSDYWKIKESEYFENVINAIDEALSITDVVGASSEQLCQCTDSHEFAETYEKEYCLKCDGLI